MRLPLASWKKTLNALGMKVVQRKPPLRPKSGFGADLALESLEERQMLSASVVDNNDARFAALGGVWSASPLGFNGGSRSTAAGDGSAAAQWTFSDLTPGQYRVSATWPGVAPLVSSGVISAQAGLSTGWQTTGTDSTVPISQDASPAAVRDVTASRANTETFVVSSTLVLDKIWVQYASRFNDNGFQVTLYKVSNPTAATLSAPSSNDPAIVLDGEVQFSQISGAGAGISTDSDTQFMSIDVGNVELTPGNYALQFSSLSSTGRTFKWVEQFDSDVGGDRFDGGDRQSDGLNYRFALQTVSTPARATNASFQILDGSTELATVQANEALLPNDMTESGVVWEDLGGPYIVNGDSVTVKLSNDANAAVVADAIRLERIGDEPLTVSLDKSSIAGTGETATATITRNNTTVGDLLVTLASSDTSQATVPSTVTIPDGESSVEFTVTGINDPALDGAQTVTITASASSYGDGTSDLSVTDQGVQQIIDDSSGSGFSTTGSWSSGSGGYSSSVKTISPGGGVSSATWSFNDLAVGTYDVYASWTDGSHTSHSPYTIYDGSTPLTTQWVDQRYNASDLTVSSTHFHHLATVTIISGSVTVRLDDFGDGTILADAVLLTRAGVNFAPQLTGADPTLVIHRDAMDQGIAVADLTGHIADVNVQDQRGIALTGTNVSGKTLQYSVDNGVTWHDVGEVSDSSAVVLPANGGRIRVADSGPFIGILSAALTIRAWDGTLGEAGDKVDTQYGGGSTAFSSNTQYISLNITPDVGPVTSVSQFPVNPLVTPSYYNMYDKPGPAVAMAADGSYVAVWAGQGLGGYQLRGQWFDAQGQRRGAEFAVADSLQPYSNPMYFGQSVAVSNGNAYIVWYDYSSGSFVVRGRLFDQDGAALSDATDISSVNNYFYASTPPPVVVPQPDGEFLVWIMPHPSHSNPEIYRVYSNGYAYYSATDSNSSSTDQVAVATNPAGDWIEGVVQSGQVKVFDDEANEIDVGGSSVYSSPSLAMNDSGRFVAAWNQGTSQIWARLYDSDGTPLTDAFQVSSFGAAQQRPSVAMDGAGNFGITWQGTDFEGNNAGVYLRWYNASGVAVSDPYNAGAAGTGYPHGGQPQIVAGPAGQFVLVWMGQTGDGQQDGILSQRFQFTQSPTVRQLPDVTIQDPFTFDLDQYFHDADAPYGESLTYTVTDNDNSTIVDAAVSSSTLTLSQGTALTAGTASITIRATDLVGNYVESMFAASVDLTNNAPVVDTPLDDVSVDEDASNTSMDLSSVFSDADTGDTLTTSIALVDNSQLVTATISGDTLQLAYAPNQSGTAHVTVRATDTQGFIVEDILTVTVDPVNDAPLLTPLGQTLSANRDIIGAGYAGFPVSQLLKGSVDVDPTDSLGVAITGLDTTYGTFQYSRDGGVSWTDIGDVDENDTLLLDASPNTRIRLRPTAPFVGTIADAITFRTWDQTSGSVGDLVDTTTNGGSTAFSADSDSISLSLTMAVGDPQNIYSTYSFFDWAWAPAHTAVANDGSQIVAWPGQQSSTNGIFVQRYSATGELVGQTFITASSYDAKLDVASIDPDNALLVYQDGSSLKAVHLDATCQPIDSPTTLGSYSTGFQIAMFPDGSYLVEDSDLNVQRYAADDTPVGSSIYVPDDLPTGGYSINTLFEWGLGRSLAVDANGGFVTVWTGFFGAYGVFVRRFDVDGIPLTDSTQVDTYNSGANVGAIASDAEGNFAVVLSSPQSGTQQLTVVRFNALAEIQGDPVVVATSATLTVGAAVAMAGQGQIAVTWWGQANDYEQGIVAQWFGADGQAIGTPLLVNTNTKAGQQVLASNTTAAPNGRFAITWLGIDTGGNGSFIGTRLFQVSQAPIADPGIDDITVDEDAAPTQIDLEQAFTDLDLPFHDHLSFSLVSNDNSSLVATQFDGADLRLSYLANQSGEANVTVRATDLDGHSYDDRFLVTVSAVNDVPTTSGIAGVGVPVNGDFDITLGSAFSDVEDADADLTYSIFANSNSSLFQSLSITDGVLHGALDSAFGHSTVTVRATDTDGAHVDAVFDVAAYEADSNLVLVPSSPSINADARGIQEGILVASLLTNVQNTATPGQVGMAIIGIDSRYGTLQYSRDGGSTWINVPTDVSPTHMFLLTGDSTTLIRFVPSASSIPLGASPATFVAWNQTHGTAGSYIDVTASGNGSLMSAAQDRLTVTTSNPNGEVLVSSKFDADFGIGISSSSADDGSFVVTWSGANGFYGRRFDALGQPLGPNFTIADYWSSGVVYMNGDGSFVACWRDATSSTGFCLQRYDSQGNIDGSQLSLSTSTYDVDKFFVATAPNGNILVTWTQAAHATTPAVDGSDVMGCIYNTSTGWGSQFTIDQGIATDPAWSFVSDVAVDKAGNFVVVWERMEDPLASWYGDIYFRRYDSSGTALGTGATKATSSSIWSYPGGRVATVSDGGFVIAWSSLDTGTNNTTILSQKYNSTAAAVGSIQTVYQGGVFGLSEVVAAPDDSLLYVWSEGDQLAAEDWAEGVYAIWVGGANVPGQQAFRVNLDASAWPGDVRAVVDASGRSFVIWEGYRPDFAGQNRVVMRQIEAPYNADSDSVGFKPQEIYTRPISVEAKTGNVIFRPDRGPDESAGAAPAGDSIQPVYRQTNFPYAIVNVDFTLPLTDLPAVFSATLNIDGIESAEPVVFSTAGYHPGDVVHLSLQSDKLERQKPGGSTGEMELLPSGHYWYRVDITWTNSASYDQNRTLFGTVELVNRVDSPFGSGWWLDSLDQLVVDQPGGLTLVRGDGTAGWFAEDSSTTDDSGEDPVETTTYRSPAGSFTALTRITTGTGETASVEYRLAHPDGTVDHFNAAGLLLKRVDRNGNAIVYAYADNRLESITDIYGLVTNYGYSSGHLATVTDFAGRVTNYTVTQLGPSGHERYYVTKIQETDPDGSDPETGGPQDRPTTDLAYYNRTEDIDAGEGGADDVEHIEFGLLREIQLPGSEPSGGGPIRHTTSIEYDAAGRFALADNADGTRWRLEAQDTAALPGVAHFSDTDTTDHGEGTESDPFRPLAPADIRATYVNERGNASGADPEKFQWTYTLDRFGYETSETDPPQTPGPPPLASVPGATWQFHRDGNGLLREKVEPAGGGGAANLGPLSTKYKYDARGNLLSVVYPQANGANSGPLSESWTYDSDFGQVLTHTDAAGYQTVDVLDERGNATEVHRQVDQSVADYHDATGGDAWTWTAAYFAYTPAWTDTDDTSDTNLPGGLVELATDPRGLKTRTVYYDFGDAGVTAAEHGLVKSITAGLGAGEESDEQESGTTTDGTLIDAATVRYQYDAARHASVVIQQMGDEDPAEDTPDTGDEPDRWTRFEYDALGRLITVTLPATVSVLPDGAPSDATDHAVTHFAYDPEDFKITQTVDLGYDEIDDEFVTQVTQYTPDAMERLHLITLPAASFYQQETPVTTTIVDTYDAAGNLQSVTDQNGHTTVYAYDGRNERISTTLPATTDAPDGSVYYYTYDTLGNIESVTDPCGNLTTYEYDALSRSTLIAAGGNASTEAVLTDFTYDDAGNLKSESRPHLPNDDVFTTDYTYDGLGRLKQVQLPSISYISSSGLPLSERPTSGRNYDANGNLINETDAEGNFTSYKYDSLDRLVEISLPPASGPDGPLTPTIDYIYNDASELATRMDPPVNGGIAQRETDYTHDGLGRLTGVSLPTVAAGTPETEYRYDRAGNLRFTVDAKQLDVWGSAEDAIDAGAVTENIYDALNRLVETIGQEVTVTASNGTTSDASPTVHYKYDAAGHGRVVTDSNGQSTVSTYNEQNQLVSVQQPDPDGGGAGVGTLTTYQRDLAGNTIRSTQTTGSGVYNYVTAYDSLNRPIKTTDPLDNYVETTYNADGTVYSTQTFDSAGTATAGETVYGYNAVGDQTSVVAPLDSETSGTTGYGYDRVGNSRKLTDPAGNVTYYTYDGLRDQTSESYTIGSETLTRYYKYDASGDMVHETDRNGREIDYVFDDLQRVTSETWTDEATSDTVNTSYDLLGRVHTVSDDFSSYTYEYDDLNRVTSVDNSGTPGVTDVVLHSGYDSNGNRTRSAATINGTADFENLYGYNADNTLAFVTQHAQDSGNAVGYKRVELGYNSANRLNGITRYASTGTGDLVADTSLTYDLAGRLETMSTRDAALTLLSGYQWHYDDKSRIDSFYSANDGTVAYQYDDQDQLTDATYSYTVSQQNEHYDYDANGNRTAVTFDAGLGTEDVRNYDTPTGSQNRISTDGVNYYEFDGEGNRIRKTNIADGPVTVYEWDVRNRLVKVTTYHNTTDADNEANPTQVVTNTYDVFNRWIGRQVDSDGDETIDHTDRFVYDGNQIVLTFSNDSDEADAPADLSHRYLWGNAVDQLFADEQEIESLVAEGRTLWALTDNLGSVRDMVEYNGTGHTTENASHIAYAAFGEITRETNTGAIQQSAYFTGKFLDKDTGQQYNINRWYDASTGQWDSTDPANADVNTRRYAGNDPVNKTDPYGLEERQLTEQELRYLDMARDELVERKVDSATIELRLAILNAAFKGIVKAAGDERNPEFFVHRGNEDGPFVVAAGKRPRDAIIDMWTYSGSEVFCHKYANLIMLKGYIDLAQQRISDYPNDSQGSQDFLNAMDKVMAGKVIPSELPHEGRGLYFSVQRNGVGPGLQLKDLMPGDQIWFENPYYPERPTAHEQELYQGEEGSNQIYLGKMDGGRIIQLYSLPGKATMTLEEKRKSFLTYPPYFSIRDWQKRTGEHALPDDFKIRRVQRPLSPSQAAKAFLDEANKLQ